MLRSWLTEAQWQEFVASRARNLPFAAASCPIPASLFDWTVLDEVLQPAQAPDLLVVRSNDVLELAPPQSSAAVRALFARGAGIVIRRAQARTASLAAIARRFAQEFAAEVQIQLFVTPARCQGFGWHYDREDVVIVQTLGVKTYYFRANTQQVALDDATPPDFAAIKRERSPLLTCTLAPGDLLYLPCGMWHAARAVEDSLSISLGLSASGAARAR